MNHAPLTPITFLERTASVFPRHTAVVYADWAGSSTPVREQTWAETLDRCVRLASSLSERCSPSDVVGVLSPNTPQFVELHHAVSMAGCLLNPINIRLEPGSLAFIIRHARCRVLFVDAEFMEPVKEAIKLLAGEQQNGFLPRLLVQIEDAQHGVSMEESHEDGSIETVDYESLVSAGDPRFRYHTPSDEWASHSVNYTSGTTGDPKGVVYSHRGAALNAVNNCLVWNFPAHSRYLWTLPMFHCAGWTIPYSVTLNAGVHVCLRKIDAASIFAAIERESVTHLCGAPVIMNMILQEAGRRGIDRIAKEGEVIR